MGLFVRDRSKGNGARTAEIEQLIAEPVQVAVSPTAIEAPAPAGPAVPAERQAYLQQMKLRLHQQLVERLDVQSLRATPLNVVRQEVRALIRELCQSEKGLLSSVEQRS